MTRNLTSSGYHNAEDARLREQSKRDSSTPRADSFAGAKLDEKTSAHSGRNDRACYRVMEGSVSGKD
jgi:hypothetical protein